MPAHPRVEASTHHYYYYYLLTRVRRRPRSGTRARSVRRRDLAAPDRTRQTRRIVTSLLQIALGKRVAARRERRSCRGLVASVASAGSATRQQAALRSTLGQVVARHNSRRATYKYYNNSNAADTIIQSTVG